MKTIVFTDEAKREDGLRVIVNSGYVEYTGETGIYKIPDHVALLLTKHGIPFKESENSEQGTPKK